MGVCVADALGVPVEFQSRAAIAKSPVTTMQGYGTYNQPPGTWSDDSSLTFCLAESLCSGYSLEDIAALFCRWYNDAYWTPYNEVFDVGNATATAIRRLLLGVTPLEAGGTDDRSNGNGSLMRILPLAFLYKSLPFPELIQRVHQVSQITHAHPKSQIACGIYISIAICLLQGLEPKAAYLQGIENVKETYSQEPYLLEMTNYRLERIMNGEIAEATEDSIYSSGYVLHTLDASLWCLLTTSSYAEAVLKAVNLGEDTDTTAAVTGGLAGIYYGFDAIAQEWVNQIARKDDIINLAARLEAAISQGKFKVS